MAQSNFPRFRHLVPPGRHGTLISFPARNAQTADFPEGMHGELMEALRVRKVKGLYVHQRAAWDAAMAGQDVIVTTGTSSGKSLCYQLPLLQRLLSEPRARALMIFPTKALANDQKERLDQFLPSGSVGVATYDGDTTAAERSRARKLAQVVVTNPDMLHVGILPQHELWADFLRNLRLIVVDEAHAYKGIFGSHVAWVMRRLLRLAEWQSPRPPQVIGCSATIADPVETFARLTGRTAVRVGQDGSPQGEKHYLFLAPVADDDLNMDGDSVGTGVLTARLVAGLAEDGTKTLAFCRSRLTVEKVLTETRRLMHAPERVDSYRAGYTAEERRGIERAIFEGRLDALISTNALELGVDIGGLDAVVMNGWPGSWASFWQQSGRAGRGNREGLTVFLAQDDPMEAALALAPEVGLGREPEPALFRPDNPHVARQQIRCLCFERPPAREEVDTWPGTSAETLADLVESGEVAYSAGRYVYPSYRSPARGVNIRGMDTGQVVLRLGRETLGQMDGARARREVYEGAIYLHRGQMFEVMRLDLEGGEAFLEPYDGPFETEVVQTNLVERTLEIQRMELGDGMAIELAGVDVTAQVTGYRKLLREGRRLVDEVELNLPPVRYDSIGVRIEVPAEMPLGALHGLEHALGAQAPILAGCDRNDLGTTWFAFDPASLSGAVVVFDAIPGGMGLAEALFHRWPEWIEAAWLAISRCRCADGCPLCLLSPRCEERNRTLDKAGTVALLDLLRRRTEDAGWVGKGTGILPDRPL